MWTQVSGPKCSHEPMWTGVLDRHGAGFWVNVGQGRWPDVDQVLGRCGPDRGSMRSGSLADVDSTMNSPDEGETLLGAWTCTAGWYSCVEYASCVNSWSLSPTKGTEKGTWSFSRDGHRDGYRDRYRAG